MLRTENPQQNRKSAYENRPFYRISDDVRRKYSAQIGNRPPHQPAPHRKYHDTFLFHLYRSLSFCAIADNWADDVEDSYWKFNSTKNPNPSPIRKMWFGLYQSGAGNRTWTCMKLLSLEPESSASANSAIPAKNGGQGWIRTIEVCDGRFTVCSLWPLGNLPIIHFVPNGTWLLYHLYSVFVNNKFK